MLERFLAQGIIADLASAFYFEKEGTLQTLVHQLKYNETTIIGVELGKHLAGAMAGLWGKLPQASIVPVPLHPAKERERGYNQSVCIAKGVHTVTGLPIHPRLLRRRKNTSSQTQLNRAERLDNVHNAFELARGAVAEDASFILVDDVITTGATIEACARVLKHCGAAKVFAASLALASYSPEGEG